MSASGAAAAPEPGHSPSDEQPELSVVIPTCDRLEPLGRCVESVLRQVTGRRFEVVIVDDGRWQRLPAFHDERVRVVQGSRRGPAAARNRGIAAARGRIVCFTDDDTLPASGWLEAAASALETRPDAVGVEGPTECEPYDPLYTAGPRNDRPGARWTCNIAYRRDGLVAVGGFDEAFPHPFCEDRDLGERMAAVGPILFAADMRVIHPPRRLRAIDVMRTAGWVESEWRLYAKHPHLRPRWPVRWAGVIGSARRWQKLLAVEIAQSRSPTRAARAAGLGLLATASALVAAILRRPGGATASVS